jgi:hypothetical protein
MIGRILSILFIGIIIMMIILWIISAGPSKTIAGARTQSNFLSLFSNMSLSQLFSLKLPWTEYRPIVQGPDISSYIGGMTGTDVQDIYANHTYDASHSTQTDQARTFGSLSPYRSYVTLQNGSSDQNDPAREYVRIINSTDNAHTINLSGWSLQSAVSGARYYLPGAADVFISGVVNSLGEITLAPGAIAIITSGSSPVGASFHENICSGYLGTLQKFYPAISTASCPSPSDALPETPDNLRTYGSSCFDYVNNIPRCSFPTDVPTTLPSACRTFIMSTYSYNGCVQLYRHTNTFARGVWRVYLNSPIELWDNAHDIIRLLDDQGRTVDTVTY